MALVSMRQLLDHAAENIYGVPAFNVNNLEQVQAIMEAAAELDAPVIMQASAGARKYAGEKFLKHLIEAAVESYPQIPVAMHQDHGQSPAVCESAIRLGFSSVMMDGSLKEDGKTVADYDYNCRVTQKVVEVAHGLGVSVEGELGCLGSLETMKGDKEDGHGAEGTMTREMLLTDPDQAADFVRRTQLDALAIAIGTSHGAYKFSRKPTGDILAIGRIKEIHRRIPNTHLVMHGSSSVPQDLLEEIRRYGGQMKETYGVPEHRYRYPAGDDGGHPQVPGGKSLQVRPARIPEACARSGPAGVPAALPAVRLRRTGVQAQAGGAGKNGPALSHRGAQPARALIRARPLFAIIAPMSVGRGDERTMATGDSRTLKGKRGLLRVVNAFHYSADGLAAAWRHEDAFRQEMIMAAVMVPTALVLPVTLVERILLIAVVMLVLIVEILNTAVEAAIDRQSFEINPLSKRAKDLGSAAVMLSLLLAGGVWISILWATFAHA